MTYIIMMHIVNTMAKFSVHVCVCVCVGGHAKHPVTVVDRKIKFLVNELKHFRMGSMY